MDPANSDPEVPDLTAHDVAAIIGLSYHAVLRAIHRGDLKAYKLCGRLKVSRIDLRAWIEESRVEIDQPPPPPEPRRGSLLALRRLEHKRRP